MQSKALRMLLLVGLIITGSTILNAGSVTCRNGPGCLNGTDSFNWATNYGPPFNPIPNNSIAISNSGVLTALVNFAGGGNGLRVDQGNGWNGNFSPGDALLWTNSPGQGPLTFTFNQPLSGLGANIQDDFFGSFTALLQVFDAHGNLIGSFSENGTSNSNGDGSAIFIGIANDPGIMSAVFSIADCSCDPNDFAINQLDVTTAAEPGVIASLSTALGLWGLLYMLHPRSPRVAESMRDKGRMCRHDKSIFPSL